VQSEVKKIKGGFEEKRNPKKPILKAGTSWQIKMYVKYAN
jgi:hypothetical protein